jgi:hypothetical protein
MIRSYGLHWRLDRVSWGKPGAGCKGGLWGAETKGQNATFVDFREQRGIYALYAEYDLIYVGQTGTGNARLFKRLNTHRRDHLSERWDRFSWFGTQWVTKENKLSADTSAISKNTDAVLNLLEAISIAIAGPRLNLQRGKWNEAKQYFQRVQTNDSLYEEEDNE